MEIKISKLYIQLHGTTANGENIEYTIDEIVLDKVDVGKYVVDRGIKHSSDNTLADGAYILVKKEDKYTLVSSEEFSPDDEAMGVAVIEGKKSLLVALDWFDYVPLIENEIKLNEPFYGTRESAYRDFNGRGNTKILLKKKSPVAELCADYSKGDLKDWWLPSFGELELMYRHKTLLNKCITACNGAVIPGDWHWSSTSMSSTTALIFDWETGNTNFGFTSYNFRYRPISVLPELTL